MQPNKNTSKLPSEQKTQNGTQIEEKHRKMCKELYNSNNFGVLQGWFSQTNHEPKERFHLCASWPPICELKVNPKNMLVLPQIHNLREKIYNPEINRNEQDIGVGYPQVTVPSFEENQTFDYDSKKKTRVNFTQEQRKFLEEYFYDHLDHPYPEKNELEMLQRKTNLSIRQIRIYMTNARMRKSGVKDKSPRRTRRGEIPIYDN